MTLWQKIKAGLQVKRFVETEIKEAKRMNTGKPGWKTTEFYLTLLTNLVAIVGALKGVIPDHVATIIVAVANGSYGVVRAITKSNTSGTSDATANVTVKAS